jgi:hypothetical protein
MLKVDEVEERPAGFHLDEEIQVARWRSLTPRTRAENAY